MSEWRRSAVLTMCGLCGGRIAVGDPILVLTLSRVKARRGQKVRCVKCDGPAPPDLPTRMVEAKPEPFALTRFSKDMLPLDFKQRQAEPGEEG